MISRFWETLFDLRDKLQSEHRFTAWNAVGDVENLLQQAYDDGMEFSSKIVDKKPDGKLEELVLSIPDIAVFYDKTDKTYFYELDNRHFDYPEEVIEYVISFRKMQQTQAMQKAKNEVLEFVKDMLTDLNYAEVLRKSSPKTVTMVKGEKDE